jgi:hypothetical protein
MFRVVFSRMRRYGGGLVHAVADANGTVLASYASIADVDIGVASGIIPGEIAQGNVLTEPVVLP